MSSLTAETVASAKNITLDDLQSPWPDPTPLPIALPAVESFDPDLLSEVLRPWIMDITERMQCSPDFPAIAAMVCLAAVVGRQIGIRPKRYDDWIVIPNLWGAIIGRPGVLKSPAIAEPIRRITALEAEAQHSYQAAKFAFEAEKMIAKARLKEAQRRIKQAINDNKGSAEAIARQSLEESPQEPIRKRYLTNDCTVEKLGELLADNPNGILIFRDELVGLLRNLDREGREGTRAFYLEAWNGTNRFTYDRIGRGTIDIEAACISVLGGIQPGPLQEYVYRTAQQGASDDGLLQRFQLLVWPDISSEWKNVDRWPDGNARHQVTALFERLANLDVMTIDATRCDDCIPYLQFDDTAQNEFDKWRDKLEIRLRTNDEHPAFEAHLSKYRSLIPSLALLCHLADGQVGPVGVESLYRACAWGEYLESHARRVYAHAIDRNLATARELDRRLQGGSVGSKFTARDIYLKGWRMLDRKSTEIALDYLADLDRVRAKEVETGGRPRVVWEINPALLRQKKVENP